MDEPDKPLTELCERAWKLLYRLGRKDKSNPRADGGYDDTMSFQFERWHIWSVNRFLRIAKAASNAANRSRPAFHTILSVDEGGHIGSLDVAECETALKRFRLYTILDDLAEI